MTVTFVVLCTLSLTAQASADPGDLDPSFGSMGLVDLPTDVDSYADVVAEPDGDLYVAEAASSVGDDRLVIVRLASGGETDTAFGEDGLVDLSVVRVFSEERFRIFNGIEDAPGGAVIASFHTAPADNPFAGGVQVFVRILADGSIDPSYGEDGVARIVKPLTSFGLGLFDVDSIGRVVFSDGEAVHRLGIDGEPDGAFAGDGSSETSFRTDLVEVGADDSVYALGPTAVTHLLASGSPDLGFGIGGVVALSDGLGRGIALKESPNGDLYTGVRYDRFENGRPTSFERFARFKPNGIADPSFSGAVAPAEIDAEGRLLTIGSGSPGSAHPLGMEVRRWTPDGHPDSAFGYEGSGYGIFTPDLASGRNRFYGGALAVQADGSVVGVGSMGFLGFSGSGLGAARFLTAPGPADADADGRTDLADRCPFLGFMDREGCPSVGVDVEAHSNRHRLRGSLTSPDLACLDQARIQIIRVRRGKSRRTGSTSAHRREDAVEARFRTKRLHDGRYFVRAKPRFAEDEYARGARAGQPLGAGYCLADRSYAVRLPGTLTPGPE